MLYVIRTDQGLFWGPRRGGYVRDVAYAGLYEESEARRWAGHIRCGGYRADEAIPADAFLAELHERAEQIAAFVGLVEQAQDVDAVDPGARSTGKRTTRAGNTSPGQAQDRTESR